MTKRIAVIVPCFNEEAVIPLLVQRIESASENWPYDWTVFLVDDGSTDRTWSAITGQCRKSLRWRGIRLSRNFGHQLAISAGLEAAEEFDAVAVIDADLQDPPERLGEFFEKWEEGYDVVYAVRTKRKELWPKRLCYWIFYRLLGMVSEIKIPLDAGDFCVLGQTVVRTLNAMPERNRFLRGMRAWAGFRQYPMVYAREARAAGKEKYTFRRLVRLAFDGIFNFSGAPLRLAAWMGFFFSGVSFFGALFTLFQRIFSEQFATVGIGPVPGFATIVVSILFLGGVQLICLGIIGEYIARVFEEVKQRPRWIISERAALDTEPNGRDGERAGEGGPS
jgi:polyisoprenyl-phosphate glycosyltransferase